jgi:mRNA interferase RelE/StbE
MWETKYNKQFLKELSKLPIDIQSRAEKIVFEELVCDNPFDSGYIEKMKGYPDKYKIRAIIELVSVSVSVLIRTINC